MKKIPALLLFAWFSVALLSARGNTNPDSDRLDEERLKIRFVGVFIEAEFFQTCDPRHGRRGKYSKC